MTSRHWGYWFFAAGAGACIALGAGHGVAAADTDPGTDAGAGATTHSRDPGPRRDALANTSHRTEKKHRGATARTDDDPAQAPASITKRGRVTSDRTDTRRVVTLRQRAARHDPQDRDDRNDTADPPVVAAAEQAGTVTGVRTSKNARLDIPVGDKELKTRADWYFPTQSDGSVDATGIVYLQHGFMGRKFFYSALAKDLSQQTNSIVVVPNIPSFPSLRCGGCWLNGTQTQQAVADLFLGDEGELVTSAAAAGYTGALPEDFVLTGHSAGGGLAAAAGGYYEADPDNGGNLRGVVMFDGFAYENVVPDALTRLGDIPVYQIAAPPQAGNLFGATTKELVASRPGQFVGVTLAGGSHVDSLLGGNPVVDLLSQLVTRFSAPGDTAAVYTVASGWINDLYRGLGPATGTGIYGAPDQYIVLGDTSAVVLAPPPVVDVNSYLGTWYEVGSVKQFFSIGLVNTKAVYGLDPDDSISVVNSGNYFSDNGPESTITGTALPVDSTNSKLKVTFFGRPNANPPGNYWIVDLDPDYQWAIVTDPTGLSGFLLSRTPVVSDDFYRELLARASVYGVKARITPTRQPAAVTTAL
ncbi:lipocalin family protein [Mycolicibacterium sp. 018/SC-01/001]|uniref:lipocalin family protein n=1 Tax=Mycolicibacterium sp. 018/SC-01/001 TaxID=2592069 RepID=UPI00117E5E3F|nr:lipocalin family protein [Mycolicibacterium sp. 018/SC-01/001]TRW88042.1 lipocalin family protein [Mycolicibacterium sp. 018/SC-01/001]